MFLLAVSLDGVVTVLVFKMFECCFFALQLELRIGTGGGIGVFKGVESEFGDLRGEFERKKTGAEGSVAKEVRQFSEGAEGLSVQISAVQPCF